MSESIIESRNLGVEFGTLKALEDLSFRVDPGSFLAIVGPNGSGKSTLLRALLGLIQPSTGDVRLFGKVPAHLAPGSIGYVPQIKTTDRHFPALAEELVATALRRRWPGRLRGNERERILDALENVGASHLAKRSLAGLSGGELQRVFLARSFVRHPRLLMLDEPMTGIDVVGTADLYSLLDVYQRTHEATIVMVTHDWDVAYHHASHVLLLNNVCVAYGPSAEVLTDTYLRKAFGHVGHAHKMLMGEHKHG